MDMVLQFNDQMKEMEKELDRKNDDKFGPINLHSNTISS